MVGDRKDVGKVDVSDHIALEVAKGLEAHGNLVFGKESGEGSGDSYPARLPVCEPEIANYPLRLAVYVEEFEVDFVFCVEFCFETSVCGFGSGSNVLGIRLPFSESRESAFDG